MITEDLSEAEENGGEQELFEHHRFVVDPGQEMLRIDKYLLYKLSGISRTKIQAGADAGNLLVNGKPVKSSYRVKPNDVITILLPHPPRVFELIAEDIPLNIQYEDDDLLIVNKPPGLVVHPGHGNYTGTLVNGLLWHINNLPNNADNRPGLVHRIDKDTSGLLVIAKTEFALAHLAKQFYDRTNDRRYLALVWGDFDVDEGTIDVNIGRSLKDRRVMDFFRDGEHGRRAVTHWKVVERFGYVTLVECKLETGRTHQIRIHMKSIGHPLFNDAPYGGDRILKGSLFTKYKQFVENCFQICPRQALHARTLAITHPTTKKWMQFDSELPDDMKQLLEKWRNYVKSRPADEDQ